MTASVTNHPAPVPSAPLDWTRGPLGHVAETDGSTGVLRWIIARTAVRRWEIVSIRTDFSRRRHGAAYTLREAKEIVGHFHAADLAHVAGARA